ncbi:hypothetical protein [Pollutibacter soli]|uniref:DoxX family protein n=1 Tax=Pollutibacter soli TaxID=3034157 RepID=UPI003013233F
MRKTPVLIRSAARVALGLMLIFAGLSHLFFARHEFMAQVPPWIPVDPGLVILISGVVEIILGFCMIFFIRQKKNIGWIIAAFFIAIFPGNISQYVNGIDAFGLNTDGLRLARLFLQPVFVFWALWSTEVIFAGTDTKW